MATRWYFPATASNSTGLTPTFDAGWNYTTEAARAELASTKGASAITTGVQVGAWTATAGQTALDRQWIGPQLSAQTISGTVSLMLMVREWANTDNVDQVHVGIFVVNSSGTKVATLKTRGNSGTTLEFSSAASGRTHTVANATALTSYACAAGDRIVVEIGYANSTAGTTPEASARWGENATDATLADNVTTADRAGWIEFSGTLSLASASVTTNGSTTSTTQGSPTVTTAKDVTATGSTTNTTQGSPTVTTTKDVTSNGSTVNITQGSPTVTGPATTLSALYGSNLAHRWGGYSGGTWTDDVGTADMLAGTAPGSSTTPSEATALAFGATYEDINTDAGTPQPPPGDAVAMQFGFVFEVDGASEGAFYIYRDTGGVFARVDFSPTTLSVPIVHRSSDDETFSISSGWHSVVVDVRSDLTARVYLDGAQVSSYASTGGPDTLLDIYRFGVEAKSIKIAEPFAAYSDTDFDLDTTAQTASDILATLLVDASADITSNSGTLSVAQGASTVTTGKDVTSNGSTVNITQGSPSATTAKDVTSSGGSVNVTHGAPAATTAKDVASNGSTVNVVHGSTAASSVYGATPNGSTVSITQGAPTVATIKEVTSSGSTVNVVQGAPSSTFASSVQASSHDVSVTGGVSVTTSKDVSASGGTVNVVHGSPTADSFATSNVIANGSTATVQHGTPVAAAGCDVQASHSTLSVSGAVSVSTGKDVQAVGAVVQVSQGVPSVDTLATANVVAEGSTVSATTGPVSVATLIEVNPAGLIVQAVAGSPTVDQENRANVIASGTTVETRHGIPTAQGISFDPVEVVTSASPVASITASATAYVGLIESSSSPLAIIQTTSAIEP